MKSPDVAGKVKGAAPKAAGEIEQGLNNVKERVTGKQASLEGDTSKSAPRSRSTPAKSSTRASGGTAGSATSRSTSASSGSSKSSRSKAGAS